MIGLALGLAGSGIFAGAALMVSVSEHPARFDVATKQAVEEFKASYPRAALLQAPAALVSSAGFLHAGLQRGVHSTAFFYASAGMAFMLPFTYFLMLGLNHQLMGASDLPPTQVKPMLERWGRLHWVRTGLSLAVFGGMIATILPI